MVENALFQQCLPHAHSLHAGVDAGALLHLPVDQLGAHAALPATVHKSIKVSSLRLIVCFMLQLRISPRAPHSATVLLHPNSGEPFSEITLSICSLEKNKTWLQGENYL